jgi:DNA-binding response OmpR family regulator
MGRILVVDDESKVPKLFEAMLKPLGHEVLTASTGQKGVEAYPLHRPMAAILELNLPDINGVEVLTEIRAVDPKAPVLIWTDADTKGLEQEARKRGVTEFLLRQFSLQELSMALNG